MLAIERFILGRRAEHIFAEYRRLCFAYWKIVPPDDRGHLDIVLGEGRPETEESFHIRGQLNSLLPEAERCASRLGIRTMGVGSGAYAGQVASYLLAATVPRQGMLTITRQEVVDTLDRCRGAASAARATAARELWFPWTWGIAAIAIVLRFPFVVLRAAGLPASIEESVWGMVVKVLLLFGLSYLGIRHADVAGLGK